MKQQTSIINVVDIEATCWSHPTPKFSEIIEVGITTINMKENKLEDPSSIILKPELNSISRFCTELTSLTQEDVDISSHDLKYVCQLLETGWKSKKYIWASWGDYDRTQFKRECNFKNVAYPFGKRHINVCTIFSLWEGLTKQVSLANAAGRLDFKFVGRQHRADVDSQMVARILLRIFNE